MEQITKPNGLLLVDKPSGWTSFDVVNKVRSTIANNLSIKPKHMKVGHSGTLDPKATGLLVLAIGPATKQLDKFLRLDKTYEVGVILGSSSSTGDSEGDITINEFAQAPELKQVRKIVGSYIGEIDQKPHRFSAVKVNGVRAYKLARKGLEFDLKPRKVTVFSLGKINYHWPQLNFDTKVSSGTYVRTLVEDIGVDLGVGAYVSSLRRTNVGPYKVSNACSVEDIDFQTIEGHLLPLD